MYRNIRFLYLPACLGNRFGNRYNHLDRQGMFQGNPAGTRRMHSRHHRDKLPTVRCRNFSLWLSAELLHTESVFGSSAFALAEAPPFARKLRGVVPSLAAAPGEHLLSFSTVCAHAGVHDLYMQPIPVVRLCRLK